jgi:hypothetical protein
MKSITTGVVMVVIIGAIIIAEEADTMEAAETTPTTRTAEVTSAEATVEVDVIKEVTMEHMGNNNVPRVS